MRGTWLSVQINQIKLLSYWWPIILKKKKRQWKVVSTLKNFLVLFWSSVVNQSLYRNKITKVIIFLQKREIQPKVRGGMQLHFLHTPRASTVFYSEPGGIPERKQSCCARLAYWARRKVKCKFSSLIIHKFHSTPMVWCGHIGMIIVLYWTVRLSFIIFSNHAPVIPCQSHFRKRG